jgi:hypothetical protein
MCAWKVDIKDEKTRDFLKSSSSEISNEVGTHFLQLANILSRSGGSKLCTSGVYPVKNYTDGLLEIHYHIDNNEEEIRITDHVIIL